jgi:alanine racemase
MNNFPLLQRIRNHFTKQQPLVEVSISRENLLHNLHTYQQRFPNMSFAPVLKSNAYGHDMGTIARLLDDEDIAFFMVDSAYEARKLRALGISTRILVMGYVRPKEMANNAISNTDYAIVDGAQLNELATIATRSVHLHLKIDTGMHRHGILPEELAAAIATINTNKNLTIVGTCSHFADADNETSAKFTQRQIERWNAALNSALSAFPTILYKHLAATKGADHIENTRTNVIRLGIGLYGIDTSTKKDTQLRPVLEMRSFISSLRTIPAGESIGYNATHTTTTPRTIATVPVGYFEGVDRRLSNKGFTLVRDIVCPIVGRVSMNMTSVDVTGVPHVTTGDVVTVISRESENSNSITEMAKLISTNEYAETPYVLLTHIAPHLKRIVEY